MSNSIQELGPGEVFVFGSNLAGKHGAGAAALAKQRFGAVEGQGTGLMGQSFAIATKDEKLNVMPIWKIDAQVKRFLKFAEEHSELTFLVTALGCGLAGYKP